MRTIAEIRLNPRDRAAIDVAAVILFGSKARGDDDRESDIDLLVLTTRDLVSSERHAVIDALFSLQLRHDVVLSALILNAEEWRQGTASALPIHDEITEQGAAALRATKPRLRLIALSFG